MLVIDATVAFDAAQFENGFRLFGSEALVAPPLMWSEVRSSLHESVWRGEISVEQGRAAFRALHDSPVRPRDHPRLGTEAWELADRMGWAKTYDAEYVVLAQLLNCRLVTSDGRLHRATSRLGFVIQPTEL
jgi:predicted nucleic acid-binding protein